MQAEQCSIEKKTELASAPGSFIRSCIHVDLRMLKISLSTPDATGKNSCQILWGASLVPRPHQGGWDLGTRLVTHRI